MKTPEMLTKLEIGGVAQCNNAPNTYGMIESNRFNNAYCVFKDKDGSVRWLQGKQGILKMGSFIMNKAEWEIQ